MTETLTYHGNYLRFSHFFEHDSLGMGSTSEGVGLEGGSQIGLFIAQNCPSLLSATVSHLTGASDSSGLAHGWVFGRFLLK